MAETFITGFQWIWSVLKGNQTKTQTISFHCGSLVSQAENLYWNFYSISSELISGRTSFILKQMNGVIVVVTLHLTRLVDSQIRKKQHQPTALTSFIMEIMELSRQMCVCIFIKKLKKANFSICSNLRHLQTKPNWALRSTNRHWREFIKCNICGMCCMKDEVPRQW